MMQNDNIRLKELIMIASESFNHIMSILYDSRNYFLIEQIKKASFHTRMFCEEMDRITEEKVQ